MSNSKPLPRSGVERSPLIALIALTIVAGALRAATIEAQSFWDDELFTVWIVRLDFVDMVRARWDSEATPPVYYLVTWLWSQLLRDRRCREGGQEEVQAERHLRHEKA